jgi:hypothetical protein
MYPFVGSYSLPPLRSPFVRPRPFVFGGISLPPSDHLIGVVHGLGAQISPHVRDAPKAHRVDRISLRPSQALAFNRASLLAGDRRAAALETLHQTTDITCGADADQQMHVRTNHPDLENPGCFLGGDPPEETAQELSQTSIDQGLAVTGSPDDVTIDAVDHAAISRPPQARPSSYFRRTGSYCGGRLG